MIPFQSDGLSAAAQRERIQFPDVNDIAKTAQESFELHLREPVPAFPAEQPDSSQRGDDQARGDENANSSDESRPAPGAPQEGEGAPESGSEPEQDSSPSLAENDEPLADEQAEHDAGETLPVSAAIEQRADETFKLAADEARTSATGTAAESDVEADDPTRRAVLAPQELESVTSAEATDALGESAAQASRGESTAERLARETTAEAATNDTAEVQEERDRESRASTTSAEKVAKEPSPEAAGLTDKQGSRRDADAPRISEAAVTSADAALGGETDAEGEDASRQRSRLPQASALQPSDTGRPENLAVPANAASRFAQHLTASGSERSETTQQITEADHRRFVDRVARAIPMAEGRGGTLRLRLSPPELGALRLEVTMQNGALSAKLEAETPLARSLLLDSLPVLRERLEEQGVRVEQFNVDLFDRQPAETPGELEQRRDQQDDTPAEGEASTSPEETTAETPTPEQRTPLGDEQLNVIV